MKQAKKLPIIIGTIIAIMSLEAQAIFSSSLSKHVAQNSVSQATKTGWQGQVQEIDEKIQVLKQWQDGYRLTAERASFKADRLQFRQDQLVDARRLWQIADEAKRKADDIQILIDELEQEKRCILLENGQINRDKN